MVSTKENPDPYTSQDTSNELKDGSKKQTDPLSFTIIEQEITDWTAQRGYAIEDQLLVPDENGLITHPYAAYTLETLQVMANNNDSTAQMLIGIKLLQEDPKKARDWLKTATVSGGYSNTMMLIADSYIAEDLNAEEDSNPNAPHTQQEDSSFSSTTITNNKLNALIWSRAAELRKDWIAEETLEQLHYAKLSKDEQEKITEQALSLLNELNNQRSQLGLPEFDDKPLDASTVQTYLSHESARSQQDSIIIE